MNKVAIAASMALPPAASILRARRRRQRMIAHHHTAAARRRPLLTVENGARSIPPVIGHGLLLPLFLALGAPEGRAPVLGETLHDTAATLALAGLAFAVIDLERMLEIAEFA